MTKNITLKIFVYFQVKCIFFDCFGIPVMFLAIPFNCNSFIFVQYFIYLSIKHGKMIKLMLSLVVTIL